MSRLEFSPQTKRDALKRAGGKCECGRVPQLGRPQGCGKSLATGAWFEHINQAYVRDDASLSNCAALTKECWREKTSIDQTVVAKVKRVADKHSGVKKPAGSIPGSRNTRWKKRMNGEVVERRTEQ